MTEEKQEIKHFLRVLNTDIDGNKQIVSALRKVHGISYSMANAICNVLEIPKLKKAGLLNDVDTKRIEEAVRESRLLPSWMNNRKRDFYTGESRHIIGSDLKFAVESDIKKLKIIRSYRGMRHAIGQPVRGQRTRNHFRHGRAVGVQKTKAAKVAAAATQSKDKVKEKK